MLCVNMIVATHFSDSPEELISTVGEPWKGKSCGVELNKADKEVEGTGFHAQLSRICSWSCVYGFVYAVITAVSSYVKPACGVHRNYFPMAISHPHLLQSFHSHLPQGLVSLVGMAQVYKVHLHLSVLQSLVSALWPAMSLYVNHHVLQTSFSDEG